MDPTLNMKHPTRRRVVVTGMGLVTPLGEDPYEYYNNLLEGVSGITEIESFDCSNYPTVCQMQFLIPREYSLI